MKTIILKFFLEKYYFIEDIEIFCRNTDKEYYDEEYKNLFLFFNFFKLGTLKFPPEVSEGF